MEKVGIDKKEFDKVVRILQQMPKEISHPTISSSAAKSLLPAKNHAKQTIASISTGETNKAIQLVRNVKIKRATKKQAPGAKLWIDGPDVYVDNRFWTARGFAKLLAVGASNRVQRTTGRSTGDFKGYGNFVVDAANKTMSAMMQRMKKVIIKDFQRSKKKAIAKYGR